MNVDKLKPGPELDALVAEKVMGWKRIKKLHGKPLADGWVGFHDGEWIRWTSNPESAYEDYTPSIFSPSTSIADAWQVVEKMRGFWKVEAYPFCRQPWTATYTPPNGPAVPGGTATAGTAPHAICLAALRAVMKEQAND